MSNNINFIQNVDISNIELAAKNPRFDNDWDPKKSLTKYLKQGNNTYNEQEIAETLLSFEDDLSKFLELIKSISDEGFDTDLDSLFVIEKEPNKYIVAEGNRRILAIKLLEEKIQLPAIDIFTTFKGDDIENNVSKKDDLKSNYEAILKIIDSYKKDPNNEFSITIANVIKDELLSKIIMSRHSSGNVKGKRDWSKGKYLFSLYQFFEKENNDNENIEIISRKFNKSPKNIKDDYKRSLWVINLIVKSGRKVGEFVNKNNVSSLYKQFVKQSLKLKGFEDETDLDKNYLDNLKVKYPLEIKMYNSKEFKEFSEVIINLFEGSKRGEMAISTRTTNPNKEAIEQIKKLFKLKADVKTGTKFKDIESVNIFQLTKQDVDKINFKKTKNKETIDKFIEVSEKLEENKDKLILEGATQKKSKINSSIVSLLNLFIYFKQRPQKFIHSLASSIRTIAEIINFAILEQDDRLKIVKNSNGTLQVKKGISNKKESLLKKKDALYKPENRNFRRGIAKIAKEIMEAIDENSDYLWTKNSTTINLNLETLINKDITNKIIHEPFNFDINNKDSVMKLIEEFNALVPTVTILLISLYS